jgi:protoheme IX farnesyltransferase
MKYLKIWIELTKPRVTTLVLVTTLPGLYLGSERVPSISLILWSLIGTFFMSSASFVFNQIIEKDLDAKMERTQNRPLPKGEISVQFAFLGGILLVFFSCLVFLTFVNWLALACALSGLLFYIFIYTLWLKPKTDQNIVIGGAAGCVGPLIGYAASSESLPLPAWILFGMIFFWTPPHFWALAIFVKEQYANANFPMMPVIRGIEQTTKSIFSYTLLYSLACIGFYFTTDQISWIYLSSTILLCSYMIFLAWKLRQINAKEKAKQFFFFSILHLFLINIFILIDYTINVT